MAPAPARSVFTLITREATRLPFVAVSLGIEAWERSRGPREFALRRGGELLQIAAHTPLGRLLPQAELDDGAQAEAERIATHARETVVATIASAADRTPPPAPPSPSPVAVEAGAPGAVDDVVEKVSEQLAIEEPASRDDLPIPDFDNVSLGSLRARLRSLSLTDLVTLREWEQAHAHRLPVLTLLANRIAKVSADSQPAYPTDPQPGA